jgi:GntR family transcriptional regulator, transcriptional repressor for pyruvate dehydrogenase complex
MGHMTQGRPTLVDGVFDRLLENILSGAIEPGKMLPPEADIAAESNVSRLTVREAIKMLSAQNIVYVKRGHGTVVNPPASWTGLESIMRAASRGVTSAQVALRLLEVRRMVETGASQLAATRHRDHDLEAMRERIGEMERAYSARDADALADADLAFHNQVLLASGNPFVPALLAQLTSLLQTARRETSRFPDVQLHAIEHHKLVLAAIESGDPVAARTAMDAHIDQTFEDYEHYLGATERGGRIPAS